ncbi:hydantoinase/oxoprolinase family protein [Halocynthiibacter styelae]|uniref:Hydantoinase/oxoprolinase family protein n=1 Tax=Halocynthiibacter styelae TaxID=2761955 RepID=A0A8J7IED3_9RHOB|nr:hydantoinase/oxoprolinase family protein [Paenihalocynthiibacter styelae]MBI1494639.1 hydantoinase/oxoprolinase family protein [Paenihalocynthiibacter styelae]
MTISLGVDTGGTYTDAVLIRDEKEVIASAKSLTTRHDLAEGIGLAVETVLKQAAIDPAEINLASLSTTLATNALIEGQGERVALILAGFREKELERHDLSGAMAGDPVLYLAGGHNYAGGQAEPLEADTLRNWLAEHGDQVSGFAVAAQFATRNPAHEQEMTAIIREVTGKPVSASHHLSAKLNGPKRAITAVLNARLIDIINRLIARAQIRLNELGISAPLMVVRGDGALISAEMALERPIETILSGPAASIVGASWMTGQKDALVSDIGGTTTDIALLRNGRPTIDPEGARVGPFRTMVEAVAMRTTGLGGDSEVHYRPSGLQGGLELGPSRVLPVSLMGAEAPEIVHEALARQMRLPSLDEHHGRFARLVPGLPRNGLEAREITLMERIGDGVKPLDEVLKNRIEQTALRRLVGRGLVQVAGVTPSDASHVLGLNDAWDREAAEMALDLFRRHVSGSGSKLADSAQDMAQMIIDQLTHQTSIALLEAGFAEEGEDFGLPASDLARHVLMQKGLQNHAGLIRIDSGLNLPVVGLGASAATYYPKVGELLGCPMDVPQYAGVANAIGAVVGRITIRRSGTVTSPSGGACRVHLETGPEDFPDHEQAIARLEEVLRKDAADAAETAGAEGIRITVKRDLKIANIEGNDVFIEAELTVEASGRPRIAV